ncbi:MAG TPA: HAD-IA family hydrolase [Bryobacteraceae bacterium]
MIPRFPVYLFDVDGTLVDSAPDICAAVQSVLHSRGRFDVPDSVLRTYIGKHLDETWSDLGFPESEWTPMLTDYREIYAKRAHKLTRRYEGVLEGLAGLTGARKSTATTKGTPTTRIVLETFGVLEHFDHVQGTDGFPAKPKPDVILKSLQVFGVKPGDALLVGDAESDMAAGRAAGLKICAVRYGYGRVEDLAKWDPDYWIDDLRELSGIK